MPIRTFKLGPLRPDEGPYFNLQDQTTINLIDARGVMNVNGGYSIQPFWYRDVETYGSVSYRKGLFAFSDPTSGGFDQYFLLARNTEIRQLIIGGSDADVSRVTAYTNTAPDYNWQFTTYGARVLATNGIDAIQSKIFSPATPFAKNNTIAAPITADPRAKFVETFKDHTFIGDFDLTAGTSGGESYGGAYGALSAQRYPNAVWWSATDNAARFADPATTPSIIGSDYRIFNDGLGAVIGLKAATDYLLVSRVGGVTIISGPPFVRENIETTCGGLFPNSMVRVNNDIYAMSRVGPVIIKNGQSVERLGTGKISRWLMQVKNILANDSNENHRRQIYGARNVTGDYIYWSIKEFDDTANAPYTHLLIYAIEANEFTIGNSNTIVTSTFRTNEVGPIASFAIPQLDIYDYGDGVVGIGTVTGISTAEAVVLMKRDVTDTTFLAEASVRTSYIGIGDASGVFQTWKPKRIRPIFSIDRYDSSVHTTVPTGWQNIFSDVVGHVNVYTRGHYSGVDFDYNVTGETPVASTFRRLDGNSYDGWFNAEECQYANFHSIELTCAGSNALAMFQLVGFDMEYELGGQTGAGLEIAY